MNTNTPRPQALCIAVLGAESSGKTTLAQALAAALTSRGLRTAWVPEVLRAWCDEQGRTPRKHEQAALLEEQHRRITAAASLHDVVVCDTTGLMTTVYSQFIFGDNSLQARALELHRSMHLSLLMALDLPWVADGHQRDGPHVRVPVDAALRHLLLAKALPFAVVSGSGPKRLEQALAALDPLLRSRPTPASGGASGLFTRLSSSDETTLPEQPHRWSCECCGDAPYERALRQQAAQ